MSISLLLEMASSTDPDRTAVVSGDLRLTTGDLSALADGGAAVVTAAGAQHVAYVGAGGALLPLLLFASARAGVPVTPLNYRLSSDGLRALISRLPDPLVVVDDEYRDAVGDGFRVIGSAEFLGPERQVFCTSLAAGVAEVVAETLVRLDALPEITPIEGLRETSK